MSFPVARATGNGEDGDQHYMANVAAHRQVAESGLQHAFIQVCPNEVDVKELTVEGELTFHNPYGYLPVSMCLLSGTAWDWLLQFYLFCCTCFARYCVVTAAGMACSSCRLSRPLEWRALLLLI